jgi:formyltetrahydrofolate deformylase
MTNYRLIVTCPDALGIVAKVSQAIAATQGWIMEANHHSDHDTKKFFMRYEISGSEAPFDPNKFNKTFSPIAKEFKMQWSLLDSQVPKKLIIMASKASHCIADLLYRHQSGDLFCEIPCVISNHPDLEKLVQPYGIPYYVATDFDKVTELWQKYDVDCIALARYMQIIPTELCAQYFGKIINIHHSFLPSFIGANPYYQAHSRGVKLIGATCHYITEQLDEGPIIEQDVVRVSHKETQQDMVRLGKDVEKTVFSRGLRYHLEDRVLIDNQKTIIFL